MLKWLVLTFTILVSNLCFANMTTCSNWQATIQNNQPSGWDYQLNPQDISVVADPQNAQSQVTQLTITPDSTWPNGHTRVEVKHDGCTTDEGQNTYFSWEFYIDKPMSTANNIAYWETDKTYQQSMGFSLQPDKGNDEHKGKKSSKLSFFTGLPSRNIHWQDTVKVATWNKIALAITWSESAKKGRVSVWFNGKNVVNGITVKTKPDANKLFIQLGLHRTQAEDTIDSISLRNVREATDLVALLKR